MLRNIRKFSTTIWAKMLLGIVIIPFVFWGMGGVFSGGNKNTLVKINNHKISTQDFMKHLNTLKITDEIIRREIDNSIIEQILNDLIRNEILFLEIKDLNITIPDLSLLQILKKDKKFFDNEKKFSRVKYEKYLIENSITATMFEENLKNNELKKILFYYISGGIYPPNFLINKTFNSQNKSVSLKGIEIENIYKKESEIQNSEIDNYINSNLEKLKEKFLTLNISKLTPNSLTLSNEFSELFFEKIDEIEEKIVNGKTFDDIIKNYNLEKININLLSENNKKQLKKYKFSDQNINKILNNTNINEVKLFDNGDEFIIINVSEISNILPNQNSEKFKKKIIEDIINEEKFKFNQSLLLKINTKKFLQSDFVELANKNNLEIKDIKIDNIRNNDFFQSESVKEIFNLDVNNFVLAFDNNLKTYLVFIKEIKNKKIKENNSNYEKYFFESSLNLKQDIYSSYDSYMQDKYKLTINQKTLNTIKNYFK